MIVSITGSDRVIDQVSLEKSAEMIKMTKKSTEESADQIANSDQGRNSPSAK
jgi:hypothetical protein